jgi:hypothetical protein
LRSSYSRNTRRPNATADTRFAASLTARRAASSAGACLASGRSFTCTTIFTAPSITPAYDTTLGAKLRCPEVSGQSIH